MLNFERKPQRRIVWMLMLVAIVAAIVMVLTPAWLIFPFKRQTPNTVELSYFLRRWSPLATALIMAFALVSTIGLWRGARWWRKGALIILTLIVGATAWAARQNHFEWMFSPLPQVVHAAAGEEGIVAGSDLVMGIEVNGEAVAYPVRQMAYHHIVNDVVGGKPVAPTY
jgi:hypothetical protein